VSRSTGFIAAALLPAASGYAAETAQMAANKRAVVEFYEKAINQKDFEAAAYLGPRHIQHTPSAADGGKVSKRFSPSRATGRPITAVRSGAFLPTVITSFYTCTTRGDRMLAGPRLSDIFKLENGKIVERWDVRQDIRKNLPIRIACSSI
jgi:predicted SnoaL-like aldol condensation-catalyzing enzyme